MPRKVDHGERREQIADAVLRVVGTRGLEAVSLRQVAGEAGVTSGMVQHYFPSRDAMVEHAMHSASAGVERRITAAMESLGDDASPRRLVRAVLAAMLPVEEASLGDGRVALGFMAYAALRPHLAERLGGGADQLATFVAAQLSAHEDEGHRIEDPEPVALALLAVAEGLGLHVLSHGLAASRAVAALDAQLDLVFGPD